MISLFIALSVYASSFQISQALHVNQIYRKVVIANHLKNVPNLRVVPSNTQNAYFDKSNNEIVVFTGLLRGANDSQIAFILGHELGHFSRNDHGGYTYDKKRNWGMEEGADEYGYKYSQNAGYSPCEIAKIMHGWGGDDTHPDGDSRLKHIGCVIPHIHFGAWA